MKFLKFFFPFTLFSFLFLAISTASAERPLITEDLELPEKGKFELEIGSITEDLGGKDKIWTNENTLIIGIHNRIEMDVNIPFQLHSSLNEHNGLTDIEILTKYLFTDESSSIPSTGFLFNLITPSGDDEKGLGEGHTGYEIKFLSEKHTEKMRFDLNLGYSFIKEGVDHLFYSFGAEYRISQKIHLVSEIVGEADYRGKNEDPLFLLGGFQFHIKGLQIDTGMRFGLTKETPDYSLILGITAPLN